MNRVFRFALIVVLLGSLLGCARSHLDTALSASRPEASHSSAGERLGVLMLHGKNPGSAQDPYFGVLKPKLRDAGWLVEMPDMPWSRSRYIDGDWDQAMAEIADHVKELRAQGAARIVLIGHSMGVPAALSFAARGGDVQGLVLLAPGHVPQRYYTLPQLSPVRVSIDRARKLMAAGHGDVEDSFNDINQGRAQSVRMTPRAYLSYFDPQSDAEMSATASRVPASVPTLVVIGYRDPLFRDAQSYFADALPANPKSKYLKVNADHLQTPVVAVGAVLQWIKQL